MVRLSERKPQIIYLILITLTAVILYTVYSGLFEEDWVFGRDHSGSDIPERQSIYPALFMGGTALISGWLTGRLVKPVTWKRYLLCGLVNIPLFHICLGVLVFISLMIVFPFINEDSEMNLVNMLNAGLFWGAITGVVSLVRCFFITSWLCLQTAIITKVILYLTDHVRHIRKLYK